MRYRNGAFGKGTEDTFSLQKAVRDRANRQAREATKQRRVEELLSQLMAGEDLSLDLDLGNTLDEIDFPSYDDFVAAQRGHDEYVQVCLALFERVRRDPDFFTIVSRNHRHRLVWMRCFHIHNCEAAQRERSKPKTPEAQLTSLDRLKLELLAKQGGQPRVA